MPLAAAGIAAGGSLLGGIASGKGAKKAAKLQAQSSAAQLAEQKSEFDTNQTNFAPYLAGGDKALSGESDLLGLNGSATQGSAIDALKASPAFTSLFNTGNDTILQDAAATGGLRGGNTQNSLANFGSSLLAQVIQQQLGNLGGLVNTGVGATQNLGSLGQQNANAVSGILSNQGQNAATGALGQAGAISTTAGSLSDILAKYLNSGSINNGITQSALSGIGALSSANPSGYVLADTAPHIPGLF